MDFLQTSPLQDLTDLIRDSKNILGFSSMRVCIYKTVCMQQLVPCGVMICAGLAGALTFHVVRVPSEWLQTNCFPSWCQATEWMALKTHTAAHHARAHTHTFHPHPFVSSSLKKKLTMNGFTQNTSDLEKKMSLNFISFHQQNSILALQNT